MPHAFPLTSFCLALPPAHVPQAFTFITEVAETFAEPVLNHYAGEAITGLDPAEYGSWDTFYIVTEHDPANATETGWYVREMTGRVRERAKVCERGRGG